MMPAGMRLLLTVTRHLSQACAYNNQGNSGGHVCCRLAKRGRRERMWSHRDQKSRALLRVSRIHSASSGRRIRPSDNGSTCSLKSLGKQVIAMQHLLTSSRVFAILCELPQSLLKRAY